MSITGIIVNYHTASFLPSLTNQLLADPEVERVIVMDNSGEVEDDGGLPPSERLRVITNRENKGFGPAVNQAMEQASGEWALLVNPDVSLDEDCMNHLLDTARLYGCPMVGPRFYWDDNRLFRLPPATGACLWMDFANKSAERYELDAELFSFYWALRHQRFWDARDPFFEPFLSGACLLVNRNWIQSQGGRLFDDNFTLYFEDTDLCTRAMGQGVRPLCVPKAEAVHYYDQSPSPDRNKNEIMIKAYASFLKKMYGAITLPNLSAPRLIRDLTDLGEKAAPPRFEVEALTRTGNCYFEIGVNPYFVPFAQAPLKEPVFEFPEEVWLRVAKREWYGRIRSSLKGNLKVWRWKKL